MIKNVKYAYSPSGVLTYKDEAERGSEYFLDAKLTVGLTYAKGEQREYFKGAYDPKAMAEFERINESVEHYNAKMKIVYDGGVTINGTFLKAIKVKAEVWIPSIKMQPDVVFLDENDKPYFIVEIKKSNKKSKEDINNLNTLKIPVYEKDINNEGADKFICLAECEEKSEYERLEAELRECKIHLNTTKEVNRAYYDRLKEEADSVSRLKQADNLKKQIAILKSEEERFSRDKGVIQGDELISSIRELERGIRRIKGSRRSRVTQESSELINSSAIASWIQRAQGY